MRPRRCIAALAWIAVAALSTATLRAEVPLAITGQVLDPTRQPLPEALVDASAAGFAQGVQTDAEGRFRIEVPAAGRYEVTVRLEGFNGVAFVAEIPTETRKEFEVTMGYATTCGYPVLDEPRMSGPTAISREDAERLPLARDPWSLLAAAPGVLLDRENVAGVEAGQQPSFVAPGASAEASTWIFEGVTITDAAALGGSPTYFDFGALSEAVIRVGGADASLATAGATIDLTTRGTGNLWRGSARLLVADGGWQSGTGVSRDDLARPGGWNLGHAQGSFAPAGRIETVRETGIEVGGPLIRDHVWLWGAYDREDADTLGLEGQPQSIGLEIWDAKLSAQIGEFNHLSGFFHRSEKEHDGRGQSLARPGPAAWRQDGSTEIAKLEDSHIFTASFYLTGLVAQVESGFSLSPRGGGVGDPAAPNAVRGPDGVWRGSYLFYSTDRPQEQAKLDGAAFLGSGERQHELRFGAGFRQAEARSVSVWPGAQLVGLADVEYLPGIYAGYLQTEGDIANRVQTTSAYASDTLTAGNFTATAGLRYDRQRGRQLATTIEPARLGPFVLGGGSAPEQSAGFEWESIVPRLSVSYALGSSRNTVLEAGYGRFADPLGTAIAGFTNPAVAGRFELVWFDQNGDLELTEDEADLFVFAGDPLPLSSSNRVDPGLDPPLTDELTLKVERLFGSRFLLGAQAAARRVTGVLEREALVYDGFTGQVRPHRRDDYEAVPAPAVVELLPDGSAASLELFRLRPGIEGTGGFALENGDREQEYRGLTIYAQARDLAGLRLRGQATVGDWRWKVPGSEREDPTPTVPAAFDDGGQVLIPATSAERRDVFLSSRWSYDLSAVYAVARYRSWSFDLGARLHGREGYPLPYHRSVDLGDGLGRRQVLLTSEADALRLDDLHLLDLRAEKTFAIDMVKLTLSLDAFNATSSTTVLQRSTQLSTASGDFVREVVHPRTLRLGLRLSY